MDRRNVLKLSVLAPFVLNANQTLNADEKKEPRVPVTGDLTIAMLDQSNKVRTTTHPLVLEVQPDGFANSNDITTEVQEDCDILGYCIWLSGRVWRVGFINTIAARKHDTITLNKGCMRLILDN